MRAGAGSCITGMPSGTATGGADPGLAYVFSCSDELEGHQLYNLSISGYYIYIIVDFVTISEGRRSTEGVVDCMRSAGVKAIVDE